MLLYYGAAVLSCVAIFAFLLLGKKKSFIGKRFSATQVVALVYSALFFVRLFGGTPLIQETIGQNVYSPFGPQGGTKSSFRSFSCG